MYINNNNILCMCVCVHISWWCISLCKKRFFINIIIVQHLPPIPPLYCPQY